MAAPLLESWLISVVESSVSSGIGGPMSAHGIITGNVDLAISVDVSVLGITTNVSAPSC